MYQTLANIRRLDPSAKIETVQDGPDKGKYYVYNSLRIPPHSSYEAPAASTHMGAVLEMWKWIENLPAGEWISVVGPDRRSWRWAGDRWQQWKRS